MQNTTTKYNSQDTHRLNTVTDNAVYNTSATMFCAPLKTGCLGCFQSSSRRFYFPLVPFQFLLYAHCKKSPQSVGSFSIVVIIFE